MDARQEPTGLHDPWADTVARIADWLEASDMEGGPALAAEVRDRLWRSQVTVAVIGQFKRGKTSLVNTWIGEDLLPVGVLPTTGVVTRVRRGPELRALVRYTEGAVQEVVPAEIGVYVDEHLNPGNVRGVRDILVETPSTSLPPWVEIVDTPGVGSTLDHATQAARAYLPWVDLALFVLSPEPPMTEMERQYLLEARQYAAKMLLVLTKSDTVSADALATLAAFSQQEAVRVMGTPVPMVTVSTLDAAARDNARAVLRQWLDRQSPVAVAQEGARRRLAVFLERAMSTVSLRLAAWESPLQEREARRHLLVRDLARLAEVREESRILWAASVDEALQGLQSYLTEAKARVLAHLAQLAQAGPPGDGPRTHYRRVHEALAQAARDQMEALLRTLREETRRLVQEAVQKRVDALNGEIARVAEDAAGQFGLPMLRFEVAAPVAEAPGFSFNWQSDPSLWPDVHPERWLALVPVGRVGQRAVAHALETLGEQVDRNIGRLHYAFRSSLERTLREAWRDVERQLDGLTRALGQAAEDLARPPDPSASAEHRRLREQLRQGQELLGQLGTTSGSSRPSEWHPQLPNPLDT